MQRGRGIKIGIAKDLNRRWKTFKTAAPSPIYVLGVIPDGGMETEQDLHERFDFCHVNHEFAGTEWFHPHWELILWLYLHGFPPKWTLDFFIGFVVYYIKCLIIGT